MIKKAVCLFILISSLFCTKAKATHLMGAEIHWKSLGSDTFEITVIVYRRCTDGASTLATPSISFASDSCSSSYSGTSSSALSHTVEDITPLCPGTSAPCNGSNGSSNSAMPAGVEKHVFKYKIFLGGTFTNCCWYKLTYQVCCRASNISTGFADQDFTQTSWLNRCVTSGDQSPAFNINPRAFFCVNFDVSYDHGATDADGDSLSYKLVLPGGGGSYNSPWSYTYPFNCLGNNTPNPGANPPTGFNLIPATGQIIFRPMQVQCTIFKVEVTEWRTINGVKKVIGKTSRDMQYFAVAGCTATSPTLPTNPVYETCVIHPICMTINANTTNTVDTVRVYSSNYTNLSGATLTTTNNTVRIASATIC